MGIFHSRKNIKCVFVVSLYKFRSPDVEVSNLRGTWACLPGETDGELTDKIPMGTQSHVLIGLLTLYS